MEAMSVVIDNHALQARSQNAAACQHGAKKRPRDAAYMAAANKAARARKKARAAALEAELQHAQEQLAQMQAQMQAQTDAHARMQAQMQAMREAHVADVAATREAAEERQRTLRDARLSRALFDAQREARWRAHT